MMDKPTQQLHGRSATSGPSDWLNNPANMTPEPAQPAESPEARAREILAQAFERAGYTRDAENIRKQLDRQKANEGHCVPLHMDISIDAMLAFAASAARPTERGAVGEARDKCRADVERLTANLERENRRWMPTRAHYEGARNDLRLAANALDAALSQPATDQAAEVERLREALQEIVNNDDEEATVSDLMQHDRNAGYLTGVRDCANIAREALATQPATGCTMGGEVDQAYNACLWIARGFAEQVNEDGVLMHNPAAISAGNEIAHRISKARAALQNGGE